TCRGTLISAGLSPGRYGVWGSTAWNEASPSVFATRSCVCWAAWPVGAIVGGATLTPTPTPRIVSTISTSPTRSPPIPMIANHSGGPPPRRPSTACAGAVIGVAASSGWPRHPPPAKQVDVQVFDRLAAIGADVRDEAPAA